MSVRARTYDRDMVDALGVNVRRVFTGVFVAGAMLAALAASQGDDVIVDAFIPSSLALVRGQVKIEYAVVHQRANA